MQLSVYTCTKTLFQLLLSPNFNQPCNTENLKCLEHTKQSEIPEDGEPAMFWVSGSRLWGLVFKDSGAWWNVGLRVSELIPKGPCTLIAYTLALKYLYRDYFKAKVSTYGYMDPGGPVTA